MMKRKTNRKTSPSSVRGESSKRVCVFCETKTEPDYKDFDVIGRFVSDRARITSRKRSGLCAKHQRRLATAVKRARHLGLL